MRSMLKEWSDKKPFTRRVRWYQGSDIRIQFEDSEGLVNVVYQSSEDAQKDYDAFRFGITNTIALRLWHIPSS